jgi:hypothetical protein
MPAAIIGEANVCPAMPAQSLELRILPCLLRARRGRGVAEAASARAPAGVAGVLSPRQQMPVGHSRRAAPIATFALAGSRAERHV